VRAELTALIGAHPMAYWEQRFLGTQCCVTPVLRLEEALQDAHFNARGMVIAAPEAGGATQFGCPVRMSDYIFEIRRPAPRPGEHCDEILAEAGYAADVLAALRQQGAVG